MHADVLARRQINQTVNTIIRNFMNKNVNPPCKVISHLPRRSIQILSECEEEVGTRSPFGASVASDDRELAIDEGVPESSVVPNLQFVPDSNVVVQEGEECVRRLLEEIEASDCRTEEASEGDSFVDIMGSLENRLDKQVSQKGSRLLTLCGVQILCQKLYWRVWSVSQICHCVSRHSSYSFSFRLRSNIVAIYILHELVYSARLFMKMASWGFCFSVWVFRRA